MSIEAFCERIGADRKEVDRMRRLIRKRINADVAASNGDPHTGNPDPSDKNASAALWVKDIDEIDPKIVQLARDMGFTEVDFGDGFHPVFRKPGDDLIIFPD